jgi:hypothetical protein
MASEIHSPGTSRPSLNCRGSITSKRRHLVLIRGFTFYGIRDVLRGQCFQRGFGNDVQTAAKNFAGETPDQKSEPLISVFRSGNWIRIIFCSPKPLPQPYLP